MNILYLIGNGFDLNLGLKTRYSDFYRKYVKDASSDKDVKKLKETITSSIDDWSDMEMALGNFTKDIKIKDHFIKVFEDIGDNLAEYLKKEVANFPYDKMNKGKLLLELSSPERMLNNGEKTALYSFRNKWKGAHWRVNIITFNYTETIEKIAEFNNRSIKLGAHHGSNQIILDNIKHIHGYMDNRMVMGVNDKSQIANENFMNNVDFVEAFIKPECNQTMGHNEDNWCRKIISNSNLICIFGCSIGDTDKIWWEQIGERLKDQNFRLIIFTRGQEIPLRREYKKAEQKRQIKNHFLNKTRLTKEEKSKLMSRIFVGVNTDMFNLLI